MTSSQMYVRVRGKVLGPFTAAQLKALKDRGQFHAFHEVSEDRASWRPASTLAGFFGTEQTAPASGGQPTVATVEPKTKSEDADEEWFYVNESNQEIGPVSRTRLIQLQHDGTIRNESQVWRRGTRDWTTFAEAGLSRQVTRKEATVAGASKPTGAPIMLFLANPVGGLPQMIERLTPGAAGVHGLLFYLFFLMMCFVGVLLAVLVHKFPFFQGLQEIANDPKRVEYMLKFMLLLVLPFACFWVSISLLRLITRSSGTFGADGLIAGSVFFGFGLTLPLLVVFFGVSWDAVVFLIGFALAFEYLQMNAAFSQTFKLPDMGILFAIPGVFFINGWLCKMAVKLLFRKEWPDWGDW